MLFFFSLSITPRLFLHALFADHKDTVSRVVKKGDNVGNTGFTCDCNNLVATSPFTDTHDEISIGIQTSYQESVALFSTRIFQNTHQFFELRGPPVLG